MLALAALFIGMAFGSPPGAAPRPAHASWRALPASRGRLPIRPASLPAAPGARSALAAPASLALPKALSPAASPTRLARAEAGARDPDAPLPGPSGVPRGELRLLPDIPSRILGNRRSAVVYLPPGYGSSGKRYPVLYVQDGQNIFDPRTSYTGVAWNLAEACDRLIAAGEMAPAVVVAVYNTPERVAEYSPVADPEYGGGRGDLYGRFLAEELKPLVDSLYRTLPGPENAILMGSSLGGLISLHLALERPDAFSAVAPLSPSLWFANGYILRRLAGSPPPGRRPRIWVSMGTREGRKAEHFKENLRLLRALRLALLARGWTPGKDLEVVEFEGGEHSERFWGKQAEAALRFLFPPG